MKICTHTYDDIISVENLLEAWQEFLRGKRHKKDVQEFQLNLMKSIFDLHNELKSKTYKHGPYKHFKINDPKPRDIHKALVRDRLLHHAVYRRLYPYFDSKFIDDSYSCRNYKGTHWALNRFSTMSRKVSKNHTSQCFILKCDIRKFFASVDHIVLMEILHKFIDDSDILNLLQNTIDSFHVREAVGLPLGNLTSQLLVNIYMNEFDQFVKHDLQIRYYIRYADDFVFLNSDKTELEKLIPKISEFLNQKLKLQMHPNKLYIKTIYSGVDFLGWVHFPRHRVIRTATKRRMFRNLEKNDYKNVSFQSYLGLLGHGNGYIIVQNLTSSII
jgi:retron-type reverse transcriptase